MKFVLDSDSQLKAFIKNSPKNATYVSPDYQKKFVKHAANDIRRQILNKVRLSSCFSIAFDETTDTAGKNIMSIIVRYMYNQELCEDFLGFFNTHAIAEKKKFFDPDCTEKKLTGIILGKIVGTVVEEFGLDLNKCVSLGSDGAAVLTSVEKGAIAYLKSISKHAIHSYCLSHCMNLCVSEVTGIAEIEIVVGLINKIASFFQ